MVFKESSEYDITSKKFNSGKVAIFFLIIILAIFNFMLIKRVVHLNFKLDDLKHTIELCLSKEIKEKNNE